MTLTLSSAHEDDVLVVQVGGELDLATAADLWSHVSGWIDRGERRILIDCTELSFLDCSGIGALVRCRQAVTLLGGWIRLCMVSVTVLRLLTITGLAQAFLGDDEIRESMASSD